MADPNQAMVKALLGSGPDSAPMNDPYNPNNSGLMGLLFKGMQPSPPIQASAPSSYNPPRATGIQAVLNESTPSENVVDLRDPTLDILYEFLHKNDPNPTFPSSSPGSLGVDSGLNDIPSGIQAQVFPYKEVRKGKVK